METYRATTRREHRECTIEADLCIVGGGLAGTCAAVTAAREGLSTVLVQDRPVLGGNASSEVRLWTLGATSHGNNNNRWAREGGVINEILVENMFRNRESNPILFDTVLLDIVAAEPQIRLLLNTAVSDVEKDASDAIRAVTAFNSQNSTRYRIAAPFFIDASGDGIVAYQAGVPFRFGAEKPEEFGEKFAPDPDTYGERLGHSIFFYTKDTGEPVRFIAPAYALQHVPEAIPRYRNFSVHQNGCQFWWIEYGGRLDTIHDTETIKWELWKIVLGVWNHIKNSGDYPDAETLTLDWVGAIPGKRESRRFEGCAMLTQTDIIAQRAHEDAVSFGGWSIDLHPADGIYSDRPKGCDQYHAKGVYPIPYRTMITPHTPNLLLAGRIISASHVAFGSTRVMGTCAHGAQAVAMAVAICREQGLQPAELLAPPRIRELQRRLLRTGQYIPGLDIDDPDDLAQGATVEASTTMPLDLSALPAPLRVRLDRDRAMLIPLCEGQLPTLHLRADVSADTSVHIRLVAAAQPTNFTPEITLGEQIVSVRRGDDRDIRVAFSGSIDGPRYAFLVLDQNPDVSIHAIRERVTGLMTVAKRHRQAPEADLGVDSFTFWTPDRRPSGYLFWFAVNADYPGYTRAFEPGQVINGIDRPVLRPNAWVAQCDDPNPTIRLSWPAAQPIGTIQLAFDTDWDHSMESVLMGHPEHAMPYCVRDYAILDATGTVVVAVKDNYQTRNTHRLAEPLRTTALSVRVDSIRGRSPAAIFGIRCFST